MPIFELQSDHGTFQIDAPDQATAVKAFSDMPQPGNSLAGSAKALGVGAAEGVIGLAGLPADAVDLAARGVDAVAGTKSAESLSGLKKLGSENIKKTIEGYTGEFYKPQTTTEKYIHGVGQFLPLAVGGPEALATRVATRAVAPGLASEAAGQLTEGTPLEPAARIIGGLAGGVGAGMLARQLERPNIPAPPANAQIAANKTANYDAAIKGNAEIYPAAVNKAVDTIERNLMREKFSSKPGEGSAAPVFDQLALLRKPEFGANHTFADLDATIRRLGDLAGEGGSVGKAAQMAKRSLEAFAIAMPVSAQAAGDVRAAGRALMQARKEAAVGFRSQMVQKAVEDARLNAASTHSGGNLENAIYQQIRTWLKRPDIHLRGWNDAEKDALRAVLPDAKSKLVRRASKVLGGGGGLGQLAAGSAGQAMFGPIGMFGFPAAGLALNKIGSSMAVSKMNNLDELLRSRSALYGPANYAARQAGRHRPTLPEIASRERLLLQALLASRLPAPNALSYQPGQS